MLRKALFHGLRPILVVNKIDRPEERAEEVVTEVMGVNSLVAAGERAGTYAVTVTRDGYEAWTRFDVEVDEDECHVIPVTLLAELEPTP